MSDSISRHAAIDALWKALYEYEDKTEKQFLESEELDIADWFQHRIFVQNMSGIDRQTLLDLPSAQPERKRGRWIDGKCSACGYGVEPWNNTPYCPNCGAYNKG